MKLIIGLIVGVFIFVLLKQLWKSSINSNTKNNLKSYGLIIILTLIFISVVDFTMRAFEIFKGDLFVQRNPSKVVQNIKIKNYRSQQNVSHPYFLYTSTPGFKGVLPLIEPNKNFKISINSHGFRTKKFYPKLPWKIRVIIMGDSFMWGYNANQDETPAAALEKIIHKKISEDVEVLSLGLTSYSGVRYASLARIYLDYLDPDILIVAVDQSDFNEDKKRFEEYILDENGYPLILKNAEKILKEEKDTFLAMDVWGNMLNENITFDPRTRIMIGSPLAETMLNFSDGLVSKSQIKEKKNKINKITKNNFSEYYPNIKIITYSELKEKYGDDISKGLPPYVSRDIIPYTFERAVKEYQSTFKSLEYIRNETLKRNQKLYFSSYPYPMMISPYENINYHVKYRKNNSIFDFSENRVHPKLMENFASKLGVTHINTYGVFEKNYFGMWGNFDPHFTAKGYNLFANSLFEGIKNEIEKRLISANKKLNQ